MRSIFAVLLDFLFPCYCVSCGIPVSSESNHLCSDCRAELIPLSDGCRCCSSPLEGGECRYCGSRKFYPVRHISVFDYSGVVKNIIHALKFGRLRDVHKAVVPSLAEKIGEIIDEVDIITYVPMSRKKQGARGYNQSLLIGRALSLTAGVPFADLLKEKGNSAAQRGLGYTGRFINVIDRYIPVGNTKFHGKTVLIVDDVFTTGATVNECARQLLMAGAKQVFSLTVARADLKKLENI